MKKFLAACLAVFLITSCAEEKESISHIHDLIPKGSSLILQSPNLSRFLTETENVPLFQNNETFGSSKIQDQIRTLSKVLSAKKALVSFIPEGDTLHYLLITQHEFINSPEDSSNKENRSILQEEIKENSTGGFTYYTGNKNGIFLASNSKSQLQRAINYRGGYYLDDEHLRLALIASDTSKTSLLVNHNYSRKNLFREINSPFQPVAQWSSLELNIENEKITFNGIASSSPDSQHILKIFQHLGVEKNKAAKITPATAKGFYSFTYTVFEELHHNLSSYRNDSIPFTGNQLLNYTNEAGVIFMEEGEILFLRATDPQLAKEAFSTSPKELTTFRDISIYKNNREGNSLDLLHPLIPKATLASLVFLDDFILFAESSEALQEIITHYLNKTTMDNQPYYEDAVFSLAEASSLLMVTNVNNHNTFIGSSEKFNLEGYSLSGIQYVQEKCFAHVHGVMGTANKAATNELSQISSINLAANTGTRPFLLRNHLNKEVEIAVQDVNNILYLFSKDGNLVWEKQLESRILGEIHQVDLFKNGNLQLAFSTQNSLQILDREGNAVAPFPHSFKDNVTQPLAVFDYDNNKDYRFVITQERELLMYDASGNIVKGFNFGRTSSPIVQPPKHIRTRNRDYLLIPEENGKLNIISRQGKSRIFVNEPINFSGNEWFLNNGEFVSITAAGELIRINEQGNVKRKLLTAEENPRLSANDGVLVVLEENKLKINDREVILDFGLYTTPEIFEINGRNFISVTDTQAKRVYIFDEKAQLLPGLPIYGNSLIDLKNEGERTIFTAQGEENNILLYRL